MHLLRELVQILTCSYNLNWSNTEISPVWTQKKKKRSSVRVVNIYSICIKMPICQLYECRETRMCQIKGISIKVINLQTMDRPNWSIQFDLKFVIRPRPVQSSHFHVTTCVQNEHSAQLPAQCPVPFPVGSHATSGLFCFGFSRIIRYLRDR